jgi:hypothetical protein
MKRWVLDCHWFSLRLHHWYYSDDSRAFHDHPWGFISIVLSGSYTDISPAGRDHLSVGSIRYRPALHRHTVQVSPGGCWTFLITGPVIRKWGFWVPRSPNSPLKGEVFRKANKYFAIFGHHPCE